ncbi:MAG: Holliday junction branch migration protein RuvA [Acholeplasmatales bacterium]|nr:Holliday junction branch migration protein RuvA [Acholeplasmatales bacterium]
MYSYIKGNVTMVCPKNITLENNNIGYEIVVPNPYNFMVSKEEVTVFIYHYLREDQETLYGFKTREEKDLFLKLISVNGIGPKSALSILASATVNEILNAIESRDDAYLKRFPGIGAKASQQIILDLHGKISFDDVSEVLNNNSHQKDIEEALVTLGYSKKDVTKAVSKLDFSLDDSTLIKLALKELNK